MKNKFVVYTALFGNYDDLVDPQEKYEGCDFICFTDQQYLKSNIWKIEIVENIDLPLNMMNRRYKILPHLFLSEYESSLYVDSNILFKRNPIYIKEKYLIHTNFVLPKHQDRNCVYEEALACIYLNKEKIKKIKLQVNQYKNDLMPKEFGLSENNILARNHNDKEIIYLMEQWWLELNKFTQRDQLSLPYVLYKLKLHYTFMDESSRKHDAFSYFNHKSISFYHFKFIKSINFKLKKSLSFIYKFYLGI